MQLILISECKTLLSKQSDCTKFERFLYKGPLMVNNFTTWPPHMRIVPLFGRCEKLYKEQYVNFPNLVKNCPCSSRVNIISNSLLTSASTNFRDMSRSPGSVKNTLIFEQFLFFREFHLNCYLSYLQFIKLTYKSFLF